MMLTHKLRHDIVVLLLHLLEYLDLLPSLLYLVHV